MKRFVVIILVILGAGALFYFVGRSAATPTISESSTPTSTPSESSPLEKSARTEKSAQEPIGPQIKIGALDIPVEPARTPAEVEKGLSGRLSLDQDKGMLFLFAQADIYSFWMPDMHFPLDMIWIGSDKKVVGISANVSNDFDPANPKFYRPPSPAQYVLEVNAGFASRSDIKIGDIVTFTNI